MNESKANETVFFAESYLAISVRNGRTVSADAAVYLGNAKAALARRDYRGAYDAAIVVRNLLNY